MGTSLLSAIQHKTLRLFTLLTLLFLVLVFNKETKAGGTDICYMASPILCGAPVGGSTAFATNDFVYCQSGTAPGVWCKFTGTGDVVTASTCGAMTDYDTQISVFSGDNCDSLTYIDCNDNDPNCGSSTFSSTVTFSSEIGTTYYILVHGAVFHTGNYILLLTCIPSCPLTTWYYDSDGDGYGRVSVSTQSCSQPANYVAVAGDCHDGNAALNPGILEVCNGIDDNCNTLIDGDDPGLQLQLCENQQGACQGIYKSPSQCVSGLWQACTDANYSANANYSSSEICGDGIDNNCNGTVDEGCSSCADIIHVATSGNDNTGCGAENSPCATLNYGIARAQTEGYKNVRIGIGSYQEIVVLVNDISLWGGFDAGWVRNGTTTITGGLGGNGEYFAMIGTNINTPTVLSDLTIVGPDAITPGKSSYGIHISNSSALQLQRVTIRGGIGANGAPGTDGTDNDTLGMDGANGGISAEYDTTCNSSTSGLGGAGGSLPGKPAANGGSGGRGGRMDTNCGIFSLDFDATDGLGGTEAATFINNGYGDGGSGGRGRDYCEAGIDGYDGTTVHGTGGAGAVTSASLTGLFWEATTGVSGNIGEDGTGGGGGGGSGGCDVGTDSYGAGGGGGGSGGVKSLDGGTGGSSGGNSVAVFMLSSTCSFINCQIILGAGGNGGSGGKSGLGGEGGEGGIGGLGVGTGAGGAGGQGGAGGNSGGGGGGAAGSVYGIWGDNSTINGTSAIAFSGGIAGAVGNGGNGLPLEVEGGNGAIGEVIQTGGSITNNALAVVPVSNNLIGYFNDNDSDGYGSSTTPDFYDCPGLSAAQLGGDCDDENQLTYPGAEELECGVDGNCDGIPMSCTECIPGCSDPAATNYNPATSADCDDGTCDYGEPCEVVGCSDPTACNYDEFVCEDDGSCIYPSPEICDGIDNDCDGLIDALDASLLLAYCEDQDGVCSGTMKSANQCVSGSWLSCTAANYFAGNANYSASEICGDGLDNDCNSQVDEFCLPNDNCSNPTPIECGQTISGTTVGAQSNMAFGCGLLDNNASPDVFYRLVGTGNTVTLSTCNNSSFDTEILVHTTCGSYGSCLVANDDYCGLQSQVTFFGSAGVTYYIRIDGFGTEAGTFDLSATCGSPCIPTTEICDGLDNNCDGTIDEGCPACLDADGDGYTTCAGDCNDGNSDVYPGAPELCDAVLDNDCSGNADYNDADNDHDGYSMCGGDCNDNDFYTNPSIAEECDNRDNNCDGANNEGFDMDGDGVFSCFGDCDDADPSVYTGATEICDDKDNDCNLDIDDALPYYSYYLDYDEDGYGYFLSDVYTCHEAPDGWVANGDDCNDRNPLINPGVAEECEFIAAFDNNCNGLIDEGFDQDGDGYKSCYDDCDDTNPDIHYGALELCDGIDNDCDGLTDRNISYNSGNLVPFWQDGDGDGYGLVTGPYPAFYGCPPVAGYATVPGDCADNDAAIYPGAPELCDGKDNNCDGLSDDADGDGYTCATDCNDNNPAINPGAKETCDGADNNCNGVVDEGFYAPVFTSPTPTCGDTIYIGVGKSKSFTVSASDANAADVVTLSVAGQPSGASFTPALPVGANPVSTTFSWTPAMADIGVYPLTFTVTDDCGKSTSCTIPIRVYACKAAINLGADATSFYGYAPQQTVTRTAQPSGAPNGIYTYSWSMSRDLMCNVYSNNGDESFSGGTCVNNNCPGTGTPASSAPYPACSGSNTISAQLMAPATVCVTVTDQGGCTGSDCFNIDALDVRCFAGNSGPKKVTVCHKTGSSTNPWVQICVDKNAVQKLLRSSAGDYLGPCSASAKTDESEIPMMEDVPLTEVKLAAYPNPFSDKLNIEFTLPQSSGARLEVFNVAGQRLAVLFEGAVKASELQKAEFNAAGNAKGMIIYKLQTETASYYGKAMIK
ncbi:MAG: MopE-related protein [Bacteroidota bacterium]